MHLHGDGVTRNFLTILEGEVRRSARGILLTLGVAALVFLLAWAVMNGVGAWQWLTVPGVFLLAFAAGALYTRHVVLGAYEVSLRDHWNRWMRWSVSCRTVRECYAKVHGSGMGPSWWAGGLVLTTLIVTHIVLLALAVDDVTSFARTLPIFALDAAIAGAVMGRRWLERRWYRNFLASCNQLLKDGALGLWGIV